MNPYSLECQGTVSDTCAETTDSGQLSLPLVSIVRPVAARPHVRLMTSSSTRQLDRVARIGCGEIQLELKFAISDSIVANQVILRVFISDNIVQFAKYVPKEKYWFLDKEITSWVCRVRPLRKLSLKLYGEGAVRVGDVIQMTEEEIQRKTSCSEKSLGLLKESLKPAGFSLGMKAPGWVKTLDRPESCR